MQYLKQRCLYLSLVGICLFSSSTQAEYFTIDTFQSTIAIQDNGSLAISEDIAVDFSEPRHGIFREIPERRHTTSWYYQISYDVVSVNDQYITYSHDPRWINDSNHPWSDSHSFVIKIGDPDLFVDDKQDYHLRYTAWPAIMDYNGYQELYRNILGSWPVRIDRASFVLSLPPSLAGHRFASGDIIVYRGSYGGQTTLPFLVSGNKISGVLTDISPDSNITIAIRFASGTFINTITPSYHESIPFARTREKLEPLGVIILFALIPLGIAWSFVLKYMRKRRNTIRKKWSDPVVVQYYPPEWLTPIEWGYIDNDQFDPREIVATLYDRAIRWYIRIQEIEKKWIARSTQYISFAIAREPSGLNELEQTLRTLIFKGKEEFSFDGKTKAFFDRIDKCVKEHSEWRYYQRWSLLAGIESNNEWIALYRQLRGYKRFLQDVEQAKLKTMLASDPLFIEKCLPRAIIFGTETQLTKAAEWLAIDTPTWYYGNHYMMYRILSNSISSGQSSYTHAVQTSSSWFSWGGWFSGGGWGWWGGGSW